MGLVGPAAGPAPHDLLRMAQRGRILDWAGESQYYVEPKRLARLGYLEARKEPGRTRAAHRVHAHRQGARRPAGVRPHAGASSRPSSRELLMRLLIADLVGEEVTRESVATLREDIADLRERLDESAAAADALPHRAQVPARSSTTSSPASSTSTRDLRRRGRARAP